jgi:cytosine deaminase
MRDAPTDADRRLLAAAFEQARKSAREGGIPIGAALGTPDGTVLAVGHNLRVQAGDTTAHAETVCIRNAGRRRDWRDLTLATTLSPCIMCSGTTLLHGVRRVVIGESATFQGAEDLLEQHGVTLVHCDDEACRTLLEGFIRAHPDIWDEDIGVPPGP